MWPQDTVPCQETSFFPFNTMHIFTKYVLLQIIDPLQSQLPSQQQDNRSNDHSLNWVIYLVVSCWHRRPPSDHQGCWDNQVIRTDGFLFFSYCSLSQANENMGSSLVEVMETAAPADI